MTTTFDPRLGPQAQPQQFFAAPAAGPIADPATRASGYPSAAPGWAPAPQVDSYPPHPQYRPAQAAWSQPGPGYPGSGAPQPSWQQPSPAANRSAIVAIIAAVVLLVAGGTVALILAHGGKSAAPVAPTAPQVPGNQLPQRPATYPQLPQTPGNGPVAPVEPGTSTGPTEQSQEPVVTQQNEDAGPGQEAAERVAGSFVAAMRDGRFDTAQGYLCSAKAEGFADRATRAATQIDLASVTLARVTVSGDKGELVMQYAMAGETRKLHESLPMVVEQGTWTVCN